MSQLGDAVDPMQSAASWCKSGLNLVCLFSTDLDQRGPSLPAICSN